MCVSTLAISALLDVALWTPRQAAFALGVVPLAVAGLWAIARPRVQPRLEVDARALAASDTART